MYIHLYYYVNMNYAIVLYSPNANIYALIYHVCAIKCHVCVLLEQLRLLMFTLVDQICGVA